MINQSCIDSAGGGINIGVILRFPSDVLVSICLLIGALGEMIMELFELVELAKLLIATLLFNSFLSIFSDDDLLVLVTLKISGFSIISHPFCEINFPYNFSWRALWK